MKIKGSPKRGVITCVRKNINNINWVSNKPHFVEIDVNGEKQLAHPSQLKRLGNK